MRHICKANFNLNAAFICKKIVVFCKYTLKLFFNFPEAISLHVPELDDLNSTSCVTPPLYEVNGTQLSNGWYYPSLVEAHKSPGDIEKWTDVSITSKNLHLP